MKVFVAGLWLLLTIMACRSDNVSPDKPLYKTWKRQSGTYQGGPSPHEVSYKDFIVEFRPDGQLLYVETKDSGGCCLPMQFQYAELTLQFGKLLSCPTVRCIAPELTRRVVWQIETLTATDLIIKTDEQRIVFKAY